MKQLHAGKDLQPQGKYFDAEIESIAKPAIVRVIDGLRKFEEKRGGFWISFPAFIGWTFLCLIAGFLFR